MRKSIILLIFYFFVLIFVLNKISYAGGGGGGCDGSIGTSLSCNTPYNDDNLSGTCIGSDPTTAANSCGPCCYAGSDLNGDGDQDVSYSVENAQWYSYCNTSGSTQTITIVVDGGSCNLQGAVWNYTTNSGLDCGSVDHDEYGSNVMGSGTFTMTTTLANGECASIMVDGYAGYLCASYGIEVQCPPTCVLPVANFTSSSPKCIGVGFDFTNTGSTGTSMGNPLYTYDWTFSGGSPGTSTAENPSGISWSAAGTYNVTQEVCLATDPTCCSTITIPVTINPPPTLSSTNVNLNCNGICTGSVDLSVAGGTSPYSYSWSSGPNTQDISNLCAGTYTVTVTDNKGCTATTSVTVTQPPALTATISSQTNVTCNGGSNGSATVSAGGGTSPYTYLWNDPAPAQSTATVTGLTAGTWTVTVTDSNGCTKTATVTITQPAPIVLSISPVATTCGLNNGSVTVTITSGGVSPFDYNWSNGAFTMNSATLTNTISSLAPGTYTVTVTDNNNCTATASASVATSSPVVAGFTYNGNQCLSGNSFNFTNTGSSGAGITYSWTFTSGTPATSTAQNPSGVTWAAAGTYAVTQTVTGPGPCTATSTINITVFPQPTVTMSQVNVTCNGLCNGTATATPASGTVPYTYIWNDPAPVQTTQTATSLCVGSYNVTVTDANLCTGIGTVTITQPGAIVLNASKTNILCFGLCTGTA
ncbi:MAG: PKD domain-containing protein, partial [Bacteroidia bacterium]|nr:PKD domain-containing protein [Bacteroidia bacterium]